MRIWRMSRLTSRAHSRYATNSFNPSLVKDDQWSDDIDYWLNNALPIGPGVDQASYPPAAYQNQTTALILGGERLYVEGHGYGTSDGNGQAWYDFVKGQSNYPGTQAE